MNPPSERRTWRIAFVSPRYAPDAAGGAEVLCRLLAEHMLERGHGVEAITTCAEDHHTWKNTLPAGKTQVNGVTVRRFPVNPGRHSGEFHALQGRISRGHRVSRRDEERWIAGSAVSDGLNSFIHSHREDFDAFIFIPYLFGITYFGAQIVPERSLLIPCLHDEPFAHLTIYRDLFGGMKGFLFNTEPERDLAQRLYNLPEEKCFLVSMGFEEPAEHSAERFRKARELHQPYLLYAGRREGGKNVPLLLEYFRVFRKRTNRDLRLLLIGTGDVSLRPDDGDSIVDLGYVSQGEKLDAMAGCLAFCQPSLNESFSIVIMETWLTGKPVLVHGKCPVTRNHAEQSNGGLHFEDYFTFEECLVYLLDHPGEAEAMGSSGGNYVRKSYSWPAVLDRFETALESLFPE